MAIFKPYHRRMQEQRGEIPDTYHYIFSEKERKQTGVILKRYLDSRWSDKLYGYLLEEFPHIAFHSPLDHEIEVITNFILNENDEVILTVLEFMLYSSCYLEDVCGAEFTYEEKRILCICDLNSRFQSERIGYKFTDDGLCIKIEDETFYEECTSKTLGVLSGKGFHDVVGYYMDSYAKVASKEYDDALVEIGRALETLLKTRFNALGIAYNEKDTLNTLLNIAKAHIPADADFDFKYFQDMILHIGRQRNQRGAHGPTQGSTPAMNEVYVRFVINQAAAALLFLAEVDMVK